jgi:hypothetical protein
VAQLLGDHEGLMRAKVPHDRLRQQRPFGAQAASRQFCAHLGVSFSCHQGFQDGACRDPANIGDH